MASYKFYYLGRDGHIVKALDADCESDLVAFNQARILANGWGIEIWQEARQVAHVDPKPKEPFPQLTSAA